MKYKLKGNLWELMVVLVDIIKEVEFFLFMSKLNDFLRVFGVIDIKCVIIEEYIYIFL